MSDPPTVHTGTPYFTYWPDKCSTQESVSNSYCTTLHACLLTACLSAFLCTPNFFTHTHTEATQALTQTLHQSGNVSQAESHINSFLEPDKVAATHINNTLLLRPADLPWCLFQTQWLSGYLRCYCSWPAISLVTTVATDSIKWDSTLFNIPLYCHTKQVLFHSLDLKLTYFNGLGKD